MSTTDGRVLSGLLAGARAIPGTPHVSGVRTEAGEELGGVGERLHLLESEDADAGERCLLYKTYATGHG